MADSGELDDIQDSLKQTLSQIEDQVSSILDGTASALDPDGVLDSLDEQADGLCRVLDRLTTTLDNLGKNEPADLNVLAEAALARQLDQTVFPVVVRSEWDRSLPELSLSSESVFSALEQTLHLSINFAGHGGEIRVRTFQFDDEAILEIEGSRLDSVVADDHTARFASVADFASTLGGQMIVNVDDSATLRLEFRLPVGIEVV